MKVLKFKVFIFAPFNYASLIMIIIFFSYIIICICLSSMWESNFYIFINDIFFSAWKYCENEYRAKFSFSKCCRCEYIAF